MWRHWKDVWQCFALCLCVSLSVVLVCIVINYSQPTQRIGYHIKEIQNTKSLTYYQVQAVNRHGLNRSIYSTANIQDAIGVLEKIQTMQEMD